MDTSHKVHPLKMKLDALLDHFRMVVSSLPQNVKPSGVLEHFQRVLEDDIARALECAHEIEQSRLESKTLLEEAERERSKAKAELQSLLNAINDLTSGSSITSKVKQDLIEVEKRLRGDIEHSKSSTANSLSKMSSSFQSSCQDVSVVKSNIDDSLRDLQAAATDLVPLDKLELIQTRVEENTRRIEEQKPCTAQDTSSKILSQIKDLALDVMDTRHAVVSLQVVPNGTTTSTPNRHGGLYMTPQSQTQSNSQSSVLEDTLTQNHNVILEEFSKLSNHYQEVQAKLSSFGHHADKLDKLGQQVDNLSHEALRTNMDIEDRLHDLSLRTDQGADALTLADQSQVNALNSKVEGIQDTLSGLLKMFSQEDDPPRKKAKSKPISPVKKSTTRFNMVKRSVEPKLSRRKTTASISTAVSVPSTDEDPQHGLPVPEDVTSQQVSQLSDRLGPAISIVNCVVPCPDSPHWVPDKIIATLWHVFASDAFAAFNIEETTNVSSKLNCWYCVKYLSQRNLNLADRDEDSECAHPWCAMQESCLQLRINRNGQKTIQLRAVSLFKNR